MTPLSVLLLDTEPRTHNHYIVLAVHRALEAHPAVGRVTIASHHDALRRFTEEKFDTFLAFGSAKTHAAVLTRLARLARLGILWTTEDPYELSNNVQYSAPFDVVFTNDKSSVAAYDGRAHHLPLAASPLFQDFAVPVGDDHYLYDLLFIGTAWPNRVASLNAILSRLGPGLAVKLALPWNDFIGPPRLDDKSLIYDWRCGNHDFARFANRSRIVLTLPRHFSASAESKASGSTPPPRLFEAGLAGACQVVVSPEPEIEDYYDKNSEIVLCGDDAAAAAAIKDLIGDPRRRMTIAAAARARTQREHLYRHRIDRLIEIALASRKAAAYPTPARRRKTILCVSHNRAGHRPGGGVEIYQELLTRLEPRFELLFLFPAGKDEPEGLRLQGRRVDRLFDIGSVERTALSDRPAERVFERILVEHQVDLVHVHHLLHLPLGLPIVAKAYGLPIVWNIHDYYVICDRYNLLNFEGRFCDVVRRGTEHCDTCLLTAEGRPLGSKARRDGLMAEVVAAVDMFLASTPFSGDYLRGYYPQIAPEKIKLLELPIPNGPGHTASEPTPLDDPEATLVVAVPGNFTHPKGADYIVELMRLCEGYNIRFEIFGRIEPHIRDRFHWVSPSAYSIMGGYDQSRIVALMAASQVSLHLSVWPETFMLSLSEAWAAGLVPIVADLGAPADRVSDGIDGFKVPPRDATAAFKALQTLYFDRDLLNRMRRTVARKRPVDIETHIETIGALYDDLIARRPCPHEAIPALRPKNFDLGLFDAGIRLNSPSWADRANLWDEQTGASRSVPSAGVSPTVDLPPEYRSLPVETIGLDSPHVELHVETYLVDGRTAATNRRDEVVLRSLSLSGYVLDDRRLDPTATFLRLRGPDGTFYARLTTVPNNDLALRYAFPPAAHAGFAGTLDVGRLPSGRYDLDLMQVASRRFLLLERAFGCIVQAAADLERDDPPLWEEEVANLLAGQIATIDATTSGAEGFSTKILDQNLPRSSGVLTGDNRGLWWMRGTLPPQRRLGGATRIAAILAADRSDQSRWIFGRRSDWSAKAVASEDRDASREAEFQVLAPLHGLDPGEYRLNIALVEGDGTAVVTTTEERLFIPPPGGRYVWTDTIPPDFRDRRIKAIRETLHLDAAVILSAMPGSRGESVVQFTGWSYAKGLGPPRLAVLTWTSGDESRHCVSAEIPRDDVAEYFETTDARLTGFSFGVPLGALRRGTLHMVQHYARRSVEFEAFQRIVTDLIASAETA